MKLLKIALLFLFFFGASGSQAAQPLKIVAIGNSITKHEPSLALGWSGNWGMGASSESTDYVSQISSFFRQKKSLATESKRINLVNLERAQSDYFPAKSVIDDARKADVLIVELGDNVPEPQKSNPAQFELNYSRLLSALVAKGSILICTGTYWDSPAVTAVIEKSCGDAGGKFVSLDGINKSVDASASYLTGAVEAVRSHPGDVGMKEIAFRIFKAVD